MWKAWRRRRELAKVEPGDRSALKPHRYWQILSRSIFQVELIGEDGRERDYAVDVEYFGWDDKIHFYVDGRQELVAPPPATFPVPRGVIEVAVGIFGASRMHLVPDDGSPERTLRPIKHSAEYWRAVLEHRHPRLSRWIAGVAIAILVIGLAIFVPQLLGMVTAWEVVAERVGTFTSPIRLPGWLNTTLVVAGLLAALERALTLRNHWLIDLDTWWLG